MAGVCCAGYVICLRRQPAQSVVEIDRSLMIEARCRFLSELKTYDGSTRPLFCWSLSGSGDLIVVGGE